MDLTALVCLVTMASSVKLTGMTVLHLLASMEDALWGTHTHTHTHTHCTPMQDEVNGYRCICDNGYEGMNCEANTDDCITNACIHGSCVVSLVLDVMFEVVKSALCLPISYGHRMEWPATAVPVILNTWEDTVRFTPPWTSTTVTPTLARIRHSAL